MKFNHNSRIVRVACVQHESMDTIEENIDTALRLIKQAVRDDAQIVCLQELFANPYFPGQNIRKRDAVSRYSEPINGPIVSLLRDTARDAGIVLVGGTIYEAGTGKKKGQHFNSAPIIDANGDLLGVHHKAHIPNDPGYFERRYFDIDNEDPTVVETEYGKIGVGICFDQWFPRFAQQAADEGAELMLYPTSIGHTNDEISGYIPGDSGFWNRKLGHVLAGHAANNHMYVGMANRIGVEGDTRFFGESGIYSPTGDMLKKLGGRSESSIVTDCDLALPSILRKAWGFHRARNSND